ncbi:MAG: glycoside hydrolase family 97 C-terminal domain-containing protein, partial [Muribaculaceae bacterium]|nr:glycoside hydrolase family 97 C-terminal domain-containing protein [Muribaculaceae bacterium]
PLDFLDKGRKYKATWIEDGINAPTQAMDYRIKNGSVGAGDTFKAKIARNGGIALIIEPAG